MEPFPGMLKTSIVPLDCRTTPKVVESPRPVPASQHPEADVIAVRLAAYCASHLITAVVDEWVAAGAAPAGPDWDEPIRLMRSTVDHLLDR